MLSKICYLDQQALGVSKVCFTAAALVVLASVLVAGPARSQVAVQASAGEYNYLCILGNDQGPGLRTVYVRLTFSLGATAARFRLQFSPGATMTYVSEATSYRSTGNAQDGISVCFDACVPDQPVLTTVTYMSYGTDERCSELRVVPHPDTDAVEVTNCDGTTVAAYSMDLQIRPPFEIPCPCPGARLYTGTPVPFDCGTVATRHTTWGSVKALYTK